jgi:hypothetical protein
LFSPRTVISVGSRLVVKHGHRLAAPVVAGREPQPDTLASCATGVVGDDDRRISRAGNRLHDAGRTHAVLAQALSAVVRPQHAEQHEQGAACQRLPACAPMVAQDQLRAQLV